MPEFVMGTGRQKSIRKVIDIVGSQLFKMQGAPRKITVRADVLEISAQRPDFEGEFESFNFRARLSKSNTDKLRELVDEYDDVSNMSEEMGWQVLDCPPLDTPEAGTDRVNEAVDKFSACLAIPEVWRVQGEDYRIEHISIELLFQAMLQYKASDVHLSPGQRPVFRIDNQARHSELLTPLSAAQILALIKELTPEASWAEFEAEKQTNFNYHQIGLGYARVSAFMKSGAPHCTLRFLPENIPSFEDLSIPTDTMVALAKLQRGLLLVAGMAGSGKTTTAAALIDWINSNRAAHIISAESPIEYVHVDKKSIISQRSLGIDVNSYGEAVLGALRQDPDIIFIGELRDADTIRSGITAAVTGQLVISTIQASTASEVVNRIVSYFDPIERDLIRTQLRDSIRCVICQRLIPKTGGGRLPALELLFNDIQPIRQAIVAGDTDALRIGIQQTTSHSFLFEEYLHKLYKDKKIDMEHARDASTEPVVLEQMVMGTYSVPRLEHLKAARDASQKG